MGFQTQSALHIPLTPG